MKQHAYTNYDWKSKCTDCCFARQHISIVECVQYCMIWVELKGLARQQGSNPFFCTCRHDLMHTEIRLAFYILSAERKIMFKNCYLSHHSMVSTVLSIVHAVPTDI